MPILDKNIIINITCRGSEEPDPRIPEVVEAPLPGEDEERGEP